MQPLCCICNYLRPKQSDVVLCRRRRSKHKYVEQGTQTLQDHDRKEDSGFSSESETGTDDTYDDVDQEWDSLFFPPALFGQCAGSSVQRTEGSSDSSSEEEEIILPAALPAAPATRGAPADWWAEVDLAADPSMFEGIAASSRLIAVEIVRHAPSATPWQLGQAERRYEEMGASLNGMHYVAVWLNLGDKSLLFLSQATDSSLFEKAIAGDFTKDRLKLILHPVSVKVPFPAKGPRDADTIGKFFGGGGSHLQCVTQSGAQVTCVQVNLYSSFLLKLALQKVGFRVGNTVEMCLIDWENRAMLAGCRLVVTEDFEKLIA